MREISVVHTEFSCEQRVTPTRVKVSFDIENVAEWERLKKTRKWKAVEDVYKRQDLNTVLKLEACRAPGILKDKCGGI